MRDYGIEPVIWDGDKNCKHNFDNIQRYNPTRGKRDGKGIYKDPKWEAKGSLKKEVESNFCTICGAWRGSLGLEPTFELYIKHLCDIFDEVKRVLRKDGTCWVNLGDTYGGSGGDSGKTIGNQRKGAHGIDTRPVGISGVEGNQKLTKGYEKSLLLIPQRFAIEMVNRGWILRNTLIWHKPNCMPSSAKDRFTVDFEYVYFFVKNKKYFFEQQFEEYTSPLDRWGGDNVKKYNGKFTKDIENIENYNSPRARQLRPNYPERGRDLRPNKHGRNKRTIWTIPNDPKYVFGQLAKKINDFKEAHPEIDEGWLDDLINELYTDDYKHSVWTIPTKPFSEAHFAVYPEKLIEPMIQAGCPRYVCKKCGKARVRIIDNSERVNTRPGNNTGNAKSGKDIDPNKGLHNSDISKYRQRIVYKELGYANCGCNAGFEGGIVLDPFMGAGTTAVVAKKQKKNYIGIELKQEYIDIANKRIIKIPETLF